MYKRIFDIENQTDEGIFLLGTRQVGKSTILPNALERKIILF